MERDRLVELLSSVRGAREAIFRMEHALLDALSEERGSGLPGNERGRGSNECFTLAERGDCLEVSRTTATASWLQTTKRRPEFRFRALLNDGAREVRFERVVTS